MAHHAINEKIDARVQNCCEVRDVGEALNPFLGKKLVIYLFVHQEVITFDNVLQVIELPDVDDGPGCVAADEDDHDAQEDHEHVHLLPKLPLRSKRL